MKKRGSTAGFTLIELIIVIVIIGILAGVAIPRFINQTTNARIAALNGMAGAINSAVMLAQAEYQAEGSNTSTSITMSGTTVAVSSGNAGGVPTAAGIISALRTVSGFNNSGTAPVQWDFPTAIANCNVQYAPATGAVTVTTTGC